MERRYADRTIELREGENGPVAVGYGSVWHDPNNPGTEYKLGQRLVERVSPTAFQRALQERQDVRGLFNHDPNMILGRTSAGTMRLTTDGIGLRYEIDLPDNQLGRDIAASIKRGDVTGSSFSFRPVKQSYQRQADGPDIRTLEDVDLFDVGPVVFPAYSAASAGLRSDEGINEVLVAWQAWRNQQEAEAVKVRARVVELL